MSTLLIDVCEIDEIQSHPNADKLEIAIVKGWKCIVPKGMYRKGQKIVYFPPDTLLPKDWTDKFGCTKYCQPQKGRTDGREFCRIRQTKLRGEPSFGLVIDPLPHMSESANWEIGQEVTDIFEAEKYEPPLVATMGDAEKSNPLFPNYTEIENMRNYPRVFREGEEVIISEKVHGTNCKVGIIEGEKMAGSRKVNRKEPEDYAKNWYWLPWSFESVQNLLIDLGKEHKQVILYGETFGNVQFLKYNRDNAIDFRAFDLFIDGTWVDYDEFKNICDSYGVPTVPLLARIPFSLEKVRELSEGQTMLNEATHIREGVVVKPVKERVDYETLRGRRVILKYVSDTYLLKNSDKDTTDI